MEVHELRFEVVIDRNHPSNSDGFVMFETGPHDGSGWNYNHESGRGALTAFFEDLIMGAPWPLKLGIHSVNGPDTVVAVALFSSRDLAIHPATYALVAATDLFHRFGSAGIAHIPSDVGKFLTLLTQYFPPSLSKEQVGERLTHAVAWVREYILEDRLPHLGPKTGAFRVVDIGSNGFVIAECERPTVAMWAEAYRAGFLRGVIFSSDREARRHVVAARKSPYVEFDLDKGARLLNELEAALGGGEWRGGSLYLHGPGEGSLILPSTVLEVLLRC